MDELNNKLSKLKKENLIEILTEVHSMNHEDVNSLINTHLIKNDPEALTASFKKQVSSWLRRRRFISYRESFEYSRDISNVRNGIERMLLPLSPESAWKLADRVVNNDGKIMDAMDDSGGCVGSELEEFCILWLKAAKQMNKNEDYWIEKVCNIAENNDYGCRESFLENACMLLSPNSLMVIFEKYKNTLIEHIKKRTETGYDFTASSFMIYMQQTALALKSPELYEEAQRILYSEPNNLQMLDVIKTHLQFNNTERALELFENTEWESRFQKDKERLLIQTYEMSGNIQKKTEILIKQWETDPSLINLKDVLEVLDSDVHDLWKETAIEKALNDSNLTRSVPVLISLGKLKEAEELLIKNQEQVQNMFYESILKILKSLKKENIPVGQTLLYRSLLDDILNRAYYKAYPHAAKYFRKLDNIDKLIQNYPEHVISHCEYKELLKEKHGRKSSFWARVEG